MSGQNEKMNLKRECMQFLVPRKKISMLMIINLIVFLLGIVVGLAAVKIGYFHRQKTESIKTLRN